MNLHGLHTLHNAHTFGSAGKLTSTQRPYSPKTCPTNNEQSPFNV